MIYIRRVKGASMVPTLVEKDIVVAIKRKNYRKGDIVIADINSHEVVKRISGIFDNKYRLIGDNREYSTDSRSWGLLSKNELKGKVIYKHKNK